MNHQGHRKVVHSMAGERRLSEDLVIFLMSFIMLSSLRRQAARHSFKEAVCSR